MNGVVKNALEQVLTESEMKFAMETGDYLNQLQVLLQALILKELRNK